MAERIVHLSIKTLFDDNHNHPDIQRFVSEFSGILYSGDGKKPAMLERLQIGADFPVRLLIGIPARSLTREQRLIAEAYCSMIFGRDLGDTKGLWTYGKGWRPKNPGKIPAPVAESELDIDWMLSLGISSHVWLNDILMAPTAFNRKNKRLPTTMLRHLFALIAFGFSDPYQFFTASNASET